MQTVLVTGANGQLGSELRKLSAHVPAIQWHFVSHTDLSITNSAALNTFFAQNRPTVVVNCAAYTQVDKAETEREQAFEVNARAVENLATSCRDFDARLIHLSTDFVFDGSKNTPYHPTDTVRPLGIYGESKEKGEQLALNALPETLIIRTAWLYSSFGHNFVKTMLRLFTQRDSINVVYDQVGSPTYAADLAAAIIHILTQQTDWKGGIYHFTNSGVASWYDLAVAVKELSGSNCNIHPIETHQYPTPARRPHYSVLSTQTFQADFGFLIGYWGAGLERCYLEIQKTL